MKSVRLFLLFLIGIALNSCFDSSSVLTTPSGRPGDVLIIIDDAVWESEGGDTLRGLFEQDIVGLPWNETLFDVSRVNHKNYVNILKTARSIVEVDISRTYTQPKVVYQREVFSKTQRYIKIQLPVMSDLTSVVEKQGTKIISYLYKGERVRYLINYKKFRDEGLMKLVKDSMGVEILIPSDFTQYNFGDNFFWANAKSNNYQKYLAIYSYSYTDQKQLDKDKLIATRDSVMKANIPGSRKGSYMSTGTFYPPVLTQFLDDGKYVAELRGIWETKNDMMGGPFVSQTRIDEKENRVVTVEMFLYAPNLEKRNTMRQLESLFYTIELPEDTIKNQATALNQ